MIQLCALAITAAVGGLVVVTLALGPVAILAPSAILAAPAFGAVSLASGLGATVLALRRG